MKTISEELFEAFLCENNLGFQRIKADSSPRPDYLVQANGVEVMFEVKELAEDTNFVDVRDTSSSLIRIHSRTLGDHVRKKINGARKQVRYAANQDVPAILLIYNNIDPLHLFGTEDADFITAMYGEYTVLLDRDTRKVVDSFNGQNQSLREDWNTEFSALGRLTPCLGKMIITLFENVFSSVKITTEMLPACFEFIKVEMSR